MSAGSGIDFASPRPDGSQAALPVPAGIHAAHHPAWTAYLPARRIVIRACLPITFAVNLCLAAMPAFAAETKTGAVQPLGVYSRIRATEDHTYGHEVRLWRLGNRLLGELIWWDANPEGQRGRFDGGAFDPRTGEVRFGVTVTRHDVQPNIRSSASFRGRLAKNVLAGNLRSEGKDAETRGKAGVEKLNLPLRRNEQLKPFLDVDTWRKAAPD